MNLNNLTLISQIGFLKNYQPFYRINKNQKSILLNIDFGQTVSMEFDFNQRYCIGWYDLETGINYACEDNATVETKYEQCKKCQMKTGFNPAFYNADSVSEVQQRRNAEPHFVYLAYFGPGFTKVGISYSGRGWARLVEQGARQAIILETFNSALVARQYEANISKLNRFVENVKLNKKLDFLKQPYDMIAGKQSLLEAQIDIENNLNIKFDNAQLLDLNQYYFAHDFDQSKLLNLIDTTELNSITGKIVGLVGCILICELDNDLLAIPLKKFIGYPVKITDQIIDIDLPDQQFSLF